MDGLREMPDNYIDLAIVDPPYGIGMDIQKESMSRDNKNGGNRHRKAWAKKWDTPPDEFYFAELMRISRHQVIWGGNYFLQYLESTRCLVIWDKIQEFSGADFETAWTSFDSSSKAFRMSRMMAYAGGDWRSKAGTKIHPTQKPVDLYKWLLKNYAKEGDLILDTHMGSGSSYIACLDMGFDYIGYEIDEDYFAAIEKRVYQFTRQTTLAY